MTKQRIHIPLGQTPALSEDQNTQTVDYITPGVLIVSSFHVVISPDGFVLSLGFFPYNGSKSIYDRMLVGGYTATNPAPHALAIQYSLNSGASWTHAELTTAFPGGTPAFNISPVGTLIEGPGCMLIDLSGIVGSTYIGIRVNAPGPGESTEFSWVALAFLFRSDAYESANMAVPLDVDPF